MNNEVQAFANAGAESWIAQQNFQIESIAASTDNNQKQVNQATNSIYGQGNTQSVSLIDNPTTGAAGYSLSWMSTPFGGSTSTPNSLPSSKWQNFVNSLSNFENQPVVRGMTGVISGWGNALDNFFSVNTLENAGKMMFDLGVVGFGADYNEQARAYLSNIGQGLSDLASATQSTDPYTRGYAWGTLAFAGTSAPLGGEVIPTIGEMGEIAAARATFTPSINPAGAMTRQYGMLQENVGYNVSPSSWFQQYTSIGQEETYLTDFEAISGNLGAITPNQQYNVGLFSYGNHS